MKNIEILKELYEEEINKLIKIDIYKIVKRLQVLHQKEEILKSLDLHDMKLVESLPKSISNKIDNLKEQNQLTDYIGTWGNLSPQKDSKRLMDEEVYELRKEKAEEEYKIKEKDNHEIREYYYIFVKVKKIEFLLEEEGIFAELGDGNNIMWICRK